MNKKKETIQDFESKWHELAEQGLLISICYGLAQNYYLYSVWVMDQKTGELFDKPYIAHSLIEALHIVERESIERGWIKKEDLS